MTEDEAPRPFATTKTTRLVHDRIEQLKDVKSQRQIAMEIGYSKPNILSMIKRGETRVPIDKVPAFAKALGVDPTYLLRISLEDCFPTLADTLNDFFSRVATENERELLLKPWRAATADSDPTLDAARAAALARFLRKMGREDGGVE
jgi:transcriptional regulator with XRE-family HTH domain